MSEMFYPEENRQTAPAEKQCAEAFPGDIRVIRRNFSLLGLGIFVMLISGTLLASVAVAAAEYLWPGVMESDWGMWLLSYIPLYGIAIPLGLLVIRKVPAVMPARYSWKPGQLAVIVTVSFFMMYAGNYLGMGITALLQLIPGVTATNPVLSITSGTALLPRVLIVSLAAPFIEEYVFRKALIDRMQLYGQKTAVVVSAALFGLFHGNLSQFFYAFALGLVFGYIYVKSGKLRYSIGLHVLINFLGGVVGPMFLEKIPFTPEGELAMEALETALPWLVLLVLYALVMVGLSLAGLVLLCIRRREITFGKSPLELPRAERFRTVWGNAGMILAVLGCLGMIVLSLFA